MDDASLAALLSTEAVPNHDAFDAEVDRQAPLPDNPPLTHIPSFTRRVDETRMALFASAPQPTAAEAILFDLAANEVAVYSELSDAREKLAHRLNSLVDADPRLALAISRVLREVVVLSGAVGRRVEHVLQTAMGIRAQRRFVELHGGRDEA